MLLDQHQQLLLAFFWLLGYVSTNNNMCFRNERIAFKDGSVHFRKIVYCCRTNNIITENDKCRECSKGYKAAMNNTCIPCDGNTYGEKCIIQCQCNNMQICDHIIGCVNQFKVTDAGPTSQYTKGTKWLDNLTTDFVNTTYQIGKASEYSKETKWSYYITTQFVDTTFQLRFSSSISNTVMYVLCAASLVVIIGLSVHFRQHCLRKMRNLCLKTTFCLRIVSHRNDTDEFPMQSLESKRQECNYNIIDEHNTVASFKNLNQHMLIDDNRVYDYPFN